MIEAAKMSVCSIRHRCLCSFDQPVWVADYCGPTRMVLQSPGRGSKKEVCEQEEVQFDSTCGAFDEGIATPLLRCVPVVVKHD